MAKRSQLSKVIMEEVRKLGINNYLDDPLAANAFLGLGDAYLIKGNS